MGKLRCGALGVTVMTGTSQEKPLRRRHVVECAERISNHESAAEWFLYFTASAASERALYAEAIAAQVPLRRGI